MRLTLRNMLAYLDGILEPSDAQDLSKKIEESKFASDLMHRIRDLMRRLRLPAPSVSERGPGLDPNTVAEYLDNTLPADRVTDFEKVCLEANTAMADMHLAEVAACHQVLTIVLGEPAEIDPVTRERIYRLPDMAAKQDAAAPPPTATTHTTHAPPPIPANPSAEAYSPQDVSLDYKARAKPTVPDYLRDPKKKKPWFAIAMGALAMALVILLLIASGQFQQGSAIGRVMVRWGLVTPKTVARTDDGPKDSGHAAAEGNKDERKPSAVESDDANAKESGKTPAPVGPETPGLPEPPGGEKPAIPPIAPGEDESPTNPGPTNVAQQPQAIPGGETPPAVIDATPPGNDVTINSVPANAAQPSEAGPAASNPPPAVKPIDAADAAPKPIGRFTSVDQILLRSNGEAGNWERAKADAFVFPQQHLLALPTYRPAITLTSTLILQMLGGTELKLLPGDQQFPAGVKIRYGRAVINSAATPGLRLRLVIGDQTGILTFLDPDSTIGIDVRRIHTPGTNPEEEPSRLMTEIFVTKDRIAWEDASGKSMEIAAPNKLLLLPGIPPVSDHPKEFPKWIASPEPIQGIEHRASQVMLQSFTPETPAQQKLLELVDPQTRLVEVRRLAVRCLGYVGYFDPMVIVLNDPAFKGEWADYYIEWLRDAVKRDPQTAAAVREALEKVYSQQAENLYRMLWGYTDKDLAAGEDAKLVESLDDDNLAVRVLAIYNLKLLTDKDLGYSPVATLPQRARIVKLWKQRLESKEIRIKQADKKGVPAVPEPPTPGVTEG
jgi:hypothetical protein